METQQSLAQTTGTTSGDSPAQAESEFKRDMGFWGNPALGFTYLSPVVGVYTTFGLAMGISGPPAFWMLAVAGLGGGGAAAGRLRLR